MNDLQIAINVGNDIIIAGFITCVNEQIITVTSNMNQKYKFHRSPVNGILQGLGTKFTGTIVK